MSWVQQTIDNGRDFPTKRTPNTGASYSMFVSQLINPLWLISTAVGADFHPNFPTVAKQIYRQLLRVFAHIYHAHFPHLLHLSAEGHFNSLFAHFLAFGRQYDLLVPIILLSICVHADLI